MHQLDLWLCSCVVGRLHRKARALDRLVSFASPWSASPADKALAVDRNILTPALSSDFIGFAGCLSNWQSYF